MSSSQLLQQGLIQEFYQRHRPWLHAWLSKKTGSSVDAADLTHDTFIRLLVQGNAQEIVEPRAYLTRIAHGIMVNFLRRRDIEQAYLNAMVSLGSGLEVAVPSPEEYLLNLEKLVAIDRMLDGLPIKVRKAFLMHKLNGMTYPEIAADLGMSVISIKKYIARALLHCAQLK
ncbi:sigma-70 family RNA polymerase sigma factor [Methylobacillus gramineus]|uniref:sigma-70 family RNA polymerase sigma factor n=1 Tax=Methylobacillus gramineus TaxID=755169 RepID=UPI001CFF9B13|nr:sigma-70 family RNA polymerase sigma factor [Methylobacillus gramineus]MCB5184763.1 sigma-70 family RNA polymerase sigma factor [Methylobacillus gramineus]